MKFLWIVFMFSMFSFSLIAQDKTTLFYCCSPEGNCMGKGYEDMGTCQQACGGDLGYRCEARATEVAAPAAAPIVPAGLPRAGTVPAVFGPTAVSPVTGDVQGISDEALPIVAGKPRQNVIAITD